MTPTMYSHLDSQELCPGIARAGKLSAQSHYLAMQHSRNAHYTNRQLYKHDWELVCPCNTAEMHITQAVLYKH